MNPLQRVILTAIETALWIPMRLGRFLLQSVMFNPRLGPLRHIASAAIVFLVFAFGLVYVVAPIRAYTGRAYLGAGIRYSAERWLATAIYDNANDFVGTFDPRLDSKRDVNYTGVPIELGDYVANPDHKSIPVREVPEHYWNCLSYHEDRHIGGWLNPYGIDLIGVLKIPASSIRRSIASKRPRLGVGGSTLPMQLARVIYDTPPSASESAFEKLRRKFGEWWIAPVIYAELTRGGDQTKLKEWTANHLWLAQRAGGASLHGVELTARVVFGKESQDLTTAEQYVLASAVNKPIILQEGSEQLNKVRLDHWRYIAEVRAKKCADKLLPDGDEQKKVVFELINMAGGPPDPVMRPKLQAALEEHVPQAAKQAMANPVLRANVLVPDVRYGVREEMKNEFGYNWRQSVREVNLTLDVIENRTFREKVRGELSRLNAKLTPKLDNAFTLDLTQLAREPGTATKRTPDVILVAANEKGEIVRYFEANDVASYFGSPNARNSETGKYEPEREGRRVASVAKMLAAVGVANEGRDGPDTLYTDTDAPEAGLETCRKGSGTLTKGRSAKVAFACSHNKPIQWRLEQLGQEPVRKLVAGFGLTMPRAASNGEMTPPTTAVARGLVAASPQRVHQMASVILASLTGNPSRRVGLPTLVRRWDLNDTSESEETPQAPPASTDIVASSLIKREAVPMLRTLLQAPLCYKSGGTHHGTLKSITNWCAETRGDLKLHFAKTGTDVSEDRDATVGVWIAGGLQFASGPAYSYVVLVGTGNTRQPWARSVHAADIAPLAEVLLQELAEHAVRGKSVAKPVARTKPKPATAAVPVASARPAVPATPPTPSIGASAAAPKARPVPASVQARSAEPIFAPPRTQAPVSSNQAPAGAARPQSKRSWGIDEATRRSIFSSAGS
jgi:penicillin-binding protein 1A